LIHISYTEENYLKAIYQYAEDSRKAVSTNAIAETLGTSPAAVTDMLQRLHEKGLVVYRKYQGVNISKKGESYALQVIRKHLLWEVFLVEKLKFGWEEVHEVAEQLEHIQSPLLMQRLDDFLGNPAYSPHGKPIPNTHGVRTHKASMVLTNVEADNSGIIIAVKDSTPQFLQYLSKRGIYLGAKISVIEKISFDQSMDISVDHLPKVNISQKVSDNILIIP
jgi:DtxR family transcriptional regulator, Mn-dependent transcriptional regulator